MFSLRKPTDRAIREFLRARRDAPHSYPCVGSSRDMQSPPGFNVDHLRVPLGLGDDAFSRAVEAVRRWTMFPPQIVQLCWPDAPIERGVLVAGLYRGPGLWAVLPCRIVYVIDEESSEVRRFGFGYGTIAGHWESGEERFLVEQHRATGEVFYDLFAFSRPAAWLARIGYPFTRREQARFRRLSGAAMQRVCGKERAVASGRPSP
jgi:uncharacterized protein (UPF0548 family)